MLDEVIRTVVLAECSAGRKSRSYKSDPAINIYMHIDFWQECMSNLSGGMTQSEYEFSTKGTILGHKVYRVIDEHTRFEVALTSE
jgi:hypothetical protein